MFKLLKNPFLIYVLGFSFAFLVYTFEWSEIYPDLTWDVKLFFLITFLGFLFMGLLTKSLKLIARSPANTKLSLIRKCTLIVALLYLFEFLVEKDIPLVAKLVGREGVAYREFGIPLLHGILISFNSFLIAHSFASYMSQKNKRILRLYFLLYIPALLILNRSIIVFGMITSLFIFLQYVDKVNFKTQLKLLTIVMVALFLFGVVGNLRSGGDYIYTQSKVKEDFMESYIPKEYYWTYLYVGSPLANFQNTVNKKLVDEFDFKGFFFYENLPKVISKNLGEPLGIEKKDLIRIVPWLTVGTAYARSYSYLKWGGPYLLFLSNILIYMFFIFLVPKRSSYHITMISVLSVIILLNIFTNMLVVAGVSFQIIYCILFSFFEGKKFILKK